MFGDGHDYDWALVEDEELGLEEEGPKGEMKYQDVSAKFISLIINLSVGSGFRAIGNTGPHAH